MPVSILLVSEKKYYKAYFTTESFDAHADSDCTFNLFLSKLFMTFRFEKKNNCFWKSLKVPIPRQRKASLGPGISVMYFIGLRFFTIEHNKDISYHITYISYNTYFSRQISFLAEPCAQCFVEVTCYVEFENELEAFRRF